MPERRLRGVGLGDEALLAVVAAGDDGAMLTFVRRYQARLFGLALGIVGDRQLAEDVTQEAFIRVFRHAASYDERRGSVASWVLVITRNLAIDRLRERRPIPHAPVDRVFLSLASTAVTPEDATERSDASAQLRASLASLPDAQRRAVILATLHGRTAAEIAAQESIPIGTAKSRLRLGLQRLRHEYVSRGS